MLVKNVVAGFKRPNGRALPLLKLPGTSPAVMADEKGDKKPMLNVLSNAYKYSG